MEPMDIAQLHKPLRKPFNSKRQGGEVLFCRMAGRKSWYCRPENMANWQYELIKTWGAPERGTGQKDREGLLERLALDWSKTRRVQRNPLRNS